MKITTDYSVPERQSPGLTGFIKACGSAIAPGRSAPVLPPGTGSASACFRRLRPVPRDVRWRRRRRPRDSKIR